LKQSDTYGSPEGGLRFERKQQSPLQSHETIRAAVVGNITDAAASTRPTTPLREEPRRAVGSVARIIAGTPKIVVLTMTRTLTEFGRIQTSANSPPIGP
jgi:hypothetical protein